MRILLLLLTVGLPAPARAADVSTYTFNSGMNCQGVWRLPDTGLTVHYSTAAGDDSDYRPTATQPRYTVLNPVGISSVTLDNITGLMWVTNPQTDAGFNKPGPSVWDVAISSCEALSYAGYTDWRLPNVNELLSIVNFGNTPRINSTAFPAALSNYYWSSTTNRSSSANGWAATFSNGLVGTFSKTTSYYVRCVRGGIW